MQKQIEYLRNKFRAGRSEILNSESWKSPPRALLERHALLIDSLIQEVYEFSYNAACQSAPRTNRSGVAIVATGGYGRKELNPFSDIDIAFVPSEEEDPWVEAFVHTAFKLVMDLFLSLKDIHVGYSFRPVSEAAAWDLVTKTSLLDLRYICGDKALADMLSDHIRQILSPLDYMVDSSLTRRNQLNGLMYRVEPNLKEGPGALRDLHRARWIFKLLLDVDDSALDVALLDRSMISAKRLSEVYEAADWFLRARTWLHLVSGKLSDVLIINYQDRIARDLCGCNSQEWLSQHLAYSEAIARFRNLAIQTLLEGPSKVNGVVLQDGAFQLKSGDLNSTIGMFHLSQRYAIPVSLADLKKLGEERDVALTVQHPSDVEVWDFLRILSYGQGAAETLRSLVEFGYLDRFIPGFSKMMRFAPPDPAHRFTVGEHSLRMVEHLERLQEGNNPEERRFSELLQQCSHFDMLCLACLLHDAGKLLPGHDHSESGADQAKSISAKLNLAPEKSDLLDLLIRNHLLLVRTARLQDVKSTSVIQRIANLVPSLEALQHLYLFTYIDTSAVAEKNWTSMDFRDMEDLYKKMQEYYAQETSDGSGDGIQKDRITMARNKLAALESNKELDVLKHCDAMPAGYVLNTPLNEIAFHLQLLERLEKENAPAIDLFNRPGEDFTELTICAYDDPAPGMLAKITGVLYGCNVNIQKAQAFTIEKEKPVVLDMLWIHANGMQISESKARRIEIALKSVLSGAQKLSEFLQKAGKNRPSSVPLETIDLSNDLSEEHTVVHIIARDLQGLLYAMTRSISRLGLDIHSAKIATWNVRAENNFYVTCSQGGQIPEQDLPTWMDRLVRELKGVDA